MFWLIVSVGTGLVHWFGTLTVSGGVEFLSVGPESLQQVLETCPLDGGGKC